MEPCLGDADRGAPGVASRSGSVGRCDEERVVAGVGWRAACAGTGWSVEVVTEASARAEVTGLDC